MKKTENSEKKIKFICMSCKTSYECFSLCQEDVKIEICGKCHYIYTGKDSSEVKIGMVDKYLQREKKSLEKRSKK